MLWLLLATVSQTEGAQGMPLPDLVPTESDEVKALRMMIRWLKRREAVLWRQEYDERVRQERLAREADRPAREAREAAYMKAWRERQEREEREARIRRQEEQARQAKLRREAQRAAATQKINDRKAAKERRKARRHND